MDNFTVRNRVASIKHKGKTFPLFTGINIIGRKTDAQIPIADINISQNHAIVTIIDENNVFISDFGSANGTKLNEEILKPLLLYKLKDGSNVLLAGKVELVYKEGFEDSQYPEHSYFIKPNKSIMSQSAVFGINTQILPQDESKLIDNSLNLSHLNIHEMQTQLFGIGTSNENGVKNDELNKSKTTFHDMPTQSLCPSENYSSFHEMETQLIGAESKNADETNNTRSEKELLMNKICKELPKTTLNNEKFIEEEPIPSTLALAKISTSNSVDSLDDIDEDVLIEAATSINNAHDTTKEDTVNVSIRESPLISESLDLLASEPFSQLQTAGMKRKANRTIQSDSDSEIGDSPMIRKQTSYKKPCIETKESTQLNSEKDEIHIEESTSGSETDCEEDSTALLKIDDINDSDIIPATQESMIQRDIKNLNDSDIIPATQDVFADKSTFAPSENSENSMRLVLTNSIDVDNDQSIKKTMIENSDDETDIEEDSNEITVKEKEPKPLEGRFKGDEMKEENLNKEKENADSFNRATQVLTRIENEEEAIEKHKNVDENDGNNLNEKLQNSGVTSIKNVIFEAANIFDCPTQVLMESNLEINDDENVFKQPLPIKTQQNATEDDSIYNCPTQILPNVDSQMKIQNNNEIEKNNSKPSTDFTIYNAITDQNDSVFCCETQVNPEIEEASTFKLLKPKEQNLEKYTVNTDIFSCPTQALPNERNYNNSEFFNLPTQSSALSEVNIDVFNCPTQIYLETTHETSKTTQDARDILITATETLEIHNMSIEGSKNQPDSNILQPNNKLSSQKDELESQLEVMFATQSTDLINLPVERPGNPVADMFSMLKTQNESQVNEIESNHVSSNDNTEDFDQEYCLQNTLPLDEIKDVNILKESSPKDAQHNQPVKEVVTRGRKKKIIENLMEEEVIQNKRSTRGQNKQKNAIDPEVASSSTSNNGSRDSVKDGQRRISRKISEKIVDKKNNEPKKLTRAQKNKMDITNKEEVAEEENNIQIVNIPATLINSELKDEKSGGKTKLNVKTRKSSILEKSNLALNSSEASSLISSLPNDAIENVETNIISKAAENISRIGRNKESNEENTNLQNDPELLEDLIKENKSTIEVPSHKTLTRTRGRKSLVSSASSSISISSAKSTESKSKRAVRNHKNNNNNEENKQYEVKESTSNSTAISETEANDKQISHNVENILQSKTKVVPGKQNINTKNSNVASEETTEKDNEIINIEHNKPDETFLSKSKFVRTRKSTIKSTNEKVSIEEKPSSSKQISEKVEIKDVYKHKEENTSCNENNSLTLPTTVSKNTEQADVNSGVPFSSSDNLKAVEEKTKCKGQNVKQSDEKEQSSIIIVDSQVAKPKKGRKRKDGTSLTVFSTPIADVEKDTNTTKEPLTNIASERKQIPRKSKQYDMVSDEDFKFPSSASTPTSMKQEDLYKNNQERKGTKRQHLISDDNEQVAEFTKKLKNKSEKIATISSLTVASTLDEAKSDLDDDFKATCSRSRAKKSIAMATQRSDSSTSGSGADVTNNLGSPRSKRPQKPKVVFTMYDNPDYESVVRRLGGFMVDTVDACTVVVTEQVKRSQKLLSAIGQAKPIVTPNWLKECKTKYKFLDPWDYIINDVEAETKWNFSMLESLNIASKKKLFEDYIFQLVVTNAADVLKGVIESCGGKCVTRTPPSKDNDHFYIVSTAENKSKYAKFLKSKNPPKVVAAEAIFLGVLQQKLLFDGFKLN